MNGRKVLRSNPTTPFLSGFYSDRTQWDLTDIHHRLDLSDHSRWSISAFCLGTRKKVTDFLSPVPTILLDDVSFPVLWSVGGRCPSSRRTNENRGQDGKVLDENKIPVILGGFGGTIDRRLNQDRHPPWPLQTFRSSPLPSWEGIRSRQSLGGRRQSIPAVEGAVEYCRRR